MKHLGFGKRLAVLILTLGGLCLAVSAPASATPTPKVTFTHPALLLNPGESQTVRVDLDTSIICPAGTLVCDVTVDFTGAFPAGITVTPAALNWSDLQWYQDRYITISVDSPSSLTPGTTYNSTAVVVSPAAYYTGYQPVLSVTLPAATPTPTATPTPDPTDVERSVQLSMTGGNESLVLFTGIGLLIVGAVVRLVAVKRKR